MSEITIVSAFFNIGREEMQGFERSNSKYVEYFKAWARMKNNLVVYTDAATAEEVLQIRDEFQLKERTKVIIIDNIYALEPEIYRNMETVLANETTINFRKYPRNPESWNAKYTYIMYLKPYFITDAVKNNYASGMIAWVDFGYNHAGDTFTHAEEFDFLWSYDFSKKIHLFALNEIDDTPIFEIIRTMKVYISGAMMIAPAELWCQLLNLYRQSALHLAHCGFTDDDQTLSVMAYKEQPELFELHPVDDFFIALKKFGGNHLTAKPVHRKLYKESKQKAKSYCKSGDYVNAIIQYCKYAKEKIQRK